MSWSLVRTCARCATRAEVDLRSRTDVLMYLHAVAVHLSGEDPHDGCPSCSPELAARVTVLGYSFEDWRAAVDRARGPREN
jgi:hypothetical protein